MKKFTCPRCPKSFNYKHHLKDHLNKKNKCDNEKDVDEKKIFERNYIINSKIINSKIMKEYLDKCQCAYCEKQFTRKDNVITHIKFNCKNIKNIENEKKNLQKIEDKSNKIEEENKILKEENNEMKINFKKLEEKILKIDGANTSIENIKKEMQDELTEIKILKENLKLKEKLDQADIEKEDDDSKIKKKKKERIPQKMRMMVWDKYIGLDKGKSKCKCCNEKEISQMDFECGHIIAEANGGQITIDNLLPICGPCNRSMKTDNFFVFQKKLETFKNK
jgi:5-methylcytosine-specific restriction endonuclease McrA